MKIFRVLLVSVGLLWSVAPVFAESRPLSNEKSDSKAKSASSKKSDSKAKKQKGNSKGKKKGNGFKFPPIKAKALRYSNGKIEEFVFEFKDVLGKKPVILFYFLPQHPISVNELKIFDKTAGFFKSTVKFLAVSKAQFPKEITAIREKMASMKLSVPVLLDEKGLLAYVMLTNRVPSYALISPKGRMTLARAGSLMEKVNSEYTLLEVLKLAASGKEPPFIVAPGYSPNSYNLVGKKAPYFSLDSIWPPTFKKKVSLTGYLNEHKKPLVLVFWSPLCPHCQKYMPLIARRVSQNKGVSLLTVSVIVDKGRRDALKHYMQKEGLNYVVLNDKKSEVFRHYRVISVPTLFFISADQVVKKVMIGGGLNFEKSLDDNLKSLLSNRRQN